jgi:tellurite resistance protein
MLFNMGFLSGKASSDTTERMLLLDMWKILQGEENNGIHENNIRKFLQAVLGFSHYVSVYSGQRKSNTPKKNKILEEFKASHEGEMEFTYEEDGSKIEESKDIQKIEILQDAMD